MFWFWVVMISLALLVGWAAWRQRRYGGTVAYDRDSLQAKEMMGPALKNFRGGRRGAKKDPN